MIASFLSSLRLDRDVEPDTCFNYLTAARFELNLNNINTEFIDHSPYIKLTKTGLTALFRADEENRVANRITQPFTVDMILRADAYFLFRNSPKDHCLSTAVRFAFFCLCRKSEYILTPDKNHHITSKCIVFVLKNPTDALLIYVATSDAHKHIAHSSWLFEVIITFPSAKNDLAGQGHRFSFFAHKLSATRLIDIASALWSLGHSRTTPA